MVQSENSPIEYSKFVTLILAIFALSFYLHSNFGTNSTYDFLRWFMGIFFVVFGSFKLIGYRMFPLMFQGYDVVAGRFHIYSYLYPFIELGLGLLYLFNRIPLARDLITLVIMAIGSIGVFQELKRRRGVHCACLGNVIKLPLSTVSLFEDVGMGLMALVMLLSQLR